MKRIKFKKDYKRSCAAEVCKLASEHFYVLTSDYSDDIELELENTDSNITEVINEILGHLNPNNQYKEADHRTIKNILTTNYILVDLYRRLGYLSSANDHSWDNAVFNGAN